ncbi:MAG TPA: carboxypeptidase-like regulatory domain-containing protein [Vicinamibacterales bacterium]|jgi:hypothetical protein|nr:carboxypeptidase-like regulatory domain-containing protein [Vicinamibacterales bacterium]
MSRFLPAALVVITAASGLPLAAQQPMTAVSPISTTIARTKGFGFSTIQGNALDSTNARMSNAKIRLRDARFGRIVDKQLTDKSGIFTFAKIEPGTYIVEIMSDDQSILAASDLLNVNAGDTVSAIVKLPFKVPPTMTLGGTAKSTAWIIATQAVASSIVAVVPTRPVSPNQ